MDRQIGSCRKLAKPLGTSKDYRSWQEAGIEPRRVERDMASNDPDFETKPLTSSASACILRSTQRYFVWIDKSAIQAFDRLNAVLPLSLGGAEHHGFEFYRHGTLSLYATLDTKTGRCTEDHGSAHQPRLHRFFRRSRFGPPCSTRDPYHSG